MVCTRSRRVGWRPPQVFRSAGKHSFAGFTPARTPGDGRLMSSSGFATLWRQGTKSCWTCICPLRASVAPRVRGSSSHRTRGCARQGPAGSEPRANPLAVRAVCGRARWRVTPSGLAGGAARLAPPAAAGFGCPPGVGMAAPVQARSDGRAHEAQRCRPIRILGVHATPAVRWILLWRGRIGGMAGGVAGIRADGAGCAAHGCLAPWHRGDRVDSLWREMCARRGPAKRQAEKGVSGGS